MSKTKYYHYYVEGNNEEKLINVLKTNLQLIPSGKVQIFNALTHHLTDGRLVGLEENSVVIFVFDTDDETVDLNILKENEKLLEDCPRVRNHFCITQVKNIEDELIRSTDIKKIEELLSSKTKSGFKNDFNRIDSKNIAGKLKKHNFDIKQLWSEKPRGKFSEINNASELIKNHFRKRV